MSTKVLGGNTTTYYIIFNQDPALALSQPEMGFLHLKRKPEGDTNAIVALLTLLSHESGGYLVFGAALADPNAYVALGKWPSLQVDYGFVTLRHRMTNTSIPGTDIYRGRKEHDGGGNAQGAGSARRAT